MAAIVYQTNKKTGITYAYESISYWDKDKQQSRAKRKCIGRVDRETQEIIPTRKRKTSDELGRKPNGDLCRLPWTARYFYGATYLFDRIGEDTGVAQDLKTCFPESYRQILSIAYYLILEDKNPLSRFPAGPRSIGIPMVRSSPPREAARFSPPSPRKPGSDFFGFRENAGWTGNIWPMTARLSPVIQNASGKSATARTKIMSIWHRSI